MPTLKNVLDAFDLLGGTVEQPMALRGILERQGFDPGDVVTAINAALASGHLSETPAGGICKGIQK